MTDLVWCELHGSTVIKTNFKPLLSCHLFGAHFVCNGEYYSLVLENAQELKISKRIWTLFTVKDDNLSVGPQILCKKCYSRMRYVQV